MNILEAEDMVKGLPDQVLFQYAQNPPPQIPQYLAVSEVQRRQEMRQRFQAQSQGQQPTVKDQILQGGSPEQAPPGGPPGGAPPGAAPPGAPMEQPMTGAPMAQMYGGGRVPGMSYMQGGGSINAGEQAEVIREANSGKARMADVLRRNLTTPEGIGRLAAGALGTAVAGPLAGYAASSGFERLFPMRQSSLQSAAQRSVQASNPFNMYGQSFAQAGAANQSQLDQAAAMGFGDARQAYIDRISSPLRGGIVRDERLGDASLNAGSGMSNGGLTPGGIVYMQEGRTVPNFLSTINSKLEEYSNANRARTAGLRPQDPNAVIAQAKDLVRQGRTQEAVGLLSQEGIDPSVLQAAPPAPPAAQIPAPGPLRRGAVEPPSITPVGIAAAVPPPAAPASAAAPSPVAPPMAAAVTPPVAPPATSQVTPPAAQPAGPVSDYQSRVDQLAGSLPGIMGQIQGLMPQAPSLTLKDLERFAPKPFDDSATMARREALINQLQQTGRTRREEDIAAAERYRSEAETPIQSAQEEARKTAIASTLMRLGAGLAAGNPAQGLANASEAVENIMTRAREQASAERRAARQEFRQAEREATRGERDVANTVFQMQAQQITSDESKQRELTRDQMQFAQWAFGQIRDQGRDARQAYTDAMRLSLDVSKTVLSVLNEELKNERISKDQYTAVAGALLRTVNETIRQNPPENMDLSTPKGQQDFNDMAINLTKTQLQSIGISSPNNLTVTSFEEVSPTSLKVNGQTINFKTEEQANAFKKSIGR